SDADSAGELMAGMVVLVSEGAASADSLWQLTTDGVITIGTTALTFARKDTLSLASNAEAQGLSVGTKAISPATLNAALQGANQTLAASGYQKLPGGLFLQWGAFSVGVGSSQSITFPISFPTACQAVVSGLYETASSDHVKVAFDLVTTSGFTARGDASSGTAAGRWLAIGY
ncbi:MAG: hypothetical protein K2X64_03085, partial [Rhodocyclaceae bacterium]|nr:hypothetical protein [Rhodocyclaceae bacterium]